MGVVAKAWKPSQVVTDCCCVLGASLPVLAAVPGGRFEADGELLACASPVSSKQRPRDRRIPAPAARRGTPGHRTGDHQIAGPGRHYHDRTTQGATAERRPRLSTRPPCGREDLSRWSPTRAAEGRGGADTSPAGTSSLRDPHTSVTAESGARSARRKAAWPSLGRTTWPLTQGKTDLSLVSVDSTAARAHHDAAGMRVDPEVLEALEKAVREQEQARRKGAPARHGTDRTPQTTPAGKSGDAPAKTQSSGREPRSGLRQKPVDHSRTHAPSAPRPGRCGSPPRSGRGTARPTAYRSPAGGGERSLGCGGARGQGPRAAVHSVTSVDIR